jgi:FkbM family methyltransferase
VGKENIRDLYFLRQSGALSRELYWMKVKDLLEKLSELSSLQTHFGNRLVIQDGKVLVDIRATQTHESRVLMVLDETDIRSVPFSVLADGYYEPIQSDILLELGKNSGRFLDIGANMGFYSLALAAESTNLFVTSFEPQPNVFKKLQKNIELNDLQHRIKPINMGLGNQKDELTMYVPKFTGTGGASFKNLHEDEGDAVEIKVPVDTLDSLETGEIDLIKIDVEGFELSVITGASTLVARSKPTIMAELLRKWMKPFGHSPQMFLEYLDGLNYRCFAINPDGLVEITQIDEETAETNFIFVHNSRTDHLDIIQKYAITR